MIELSGKAIRTMSSLEIAELLGKRHDNVVRDIIEQLCKLEGGILKFEDTYVNSQNKQEYRLYNLPYRETMILISGYSVELRAKVINRWMELEQGEANNNDNSLSLENKAIEVIEGLLAKTKKQADIIQELEPKAQFADCIADNPKFYSFREASKLLGFENMGEKKLFSFCREQGLLMVEYPNSNQPYQKYVDKGYFKTVVQNYDRPNGETFVNIKSVITGKGLDYLSKLLFGNGHRKVSEFELFQMKNIEELQMA